MGCYGAVVLLAVTTCSFAMSLEENASLNKNRYTRLYPKLDEREWTRNSLCWASDRLQEVGEKALYPLTTFGETHYRVLCTQMGKGVFCVRISVAPRSHRISCYTWHSSKKGLLLHGKSTAILTDNDPSVLSPLLNTSDFWTLPPFPHKLMYVDGVRWFIEAVQDGKYHMIYLESEAEGKMRDFCSAVCRLAKNTCKTVARDIDMILGKLKLKGVND